MKRALKALDREVRKHAAEAGHQVPAEAVLVTTQHQEHQILYEVFGDKRDGYAVDIGAGDGIRLSNTLHLEMAGWTVLCIEPNPIYVKKLRRVRERVLGVACADRNADRQDFTICEVMPDNFEACSALEVDPVMLKEMQEHPDHQEFKKPPRKIKVKVRTLDWCLEQAGFPALDFLSVDVEGGEKAVLDGFDIDRWRPKVVILEDWRGGRYRSRMCRHGYYVHSRRGPNEIFVRADDE